MTIIRSTLIAAAAAVAFTSGAALAQTKAPAKPVKPRSEASLACSKQADAQKLTGKARKTFRTACLKKAKAAAGTAKPAPATAAPAKAAPAPAKAAPAKKN